MIDKNKKYRTREGSNVTIYSTDAGGHYPVHGAIFSIFNDNGWEIGSWDSDGRYDIDKDCHRHDLVEVKPRIKQSVWLNVYPTNVAGAYETKEGADNQAHKGIRIACVKVDIDCEEGEGLD